MLQDLNFELMVLAKQKRGLERIFEVSTSPDTYEKTSAIRALGVYGGRQVFKRLLELSFDDDPIAQNDAIIALGNCEDSRAFFVHAYCFFHPNILREDLNERSKNEILKSILYGLIASKDQRALSLLEEITEKEGYRRDLASIAKVAIRRLKNQSSSKFLYDFLGDEEDVEQARNYGGITLDGQNSFIPIKDILDGEAQMNDRTHYQTYVVDSNLKFIIGGHLQEHVMVASGRRVLTAGEVIFKQNPRGKWFIEYINNRSNGYLPSTESYPQIASALKGKKIGYPPNFSEIFPKGGYTDEEFLLVRWIDISKLLEK